MPPRLLSNANLEHSALEFLLVVRRALWDFILQNTAVLLVRSVQMAINVKQAAAFLSSVLKEVTHR